MKLDTARYTARTGIESPDEEVWILQAKHDSLASQHAALQRQQAQLQGEQGAMQSSAKARSGNADAVKAEARSQVAEHAGELAAAQSALLSMKQDRSCDLQQNESQVHTP